MVLQSEKPLQLMSSLLLPGKPTRAGEVLKKFVMQLHVNNCTEKKLQFTVLTATLCTAYTWEACTFCLNCIFLLDYWLS